MRLILIWQCFYVLIRVRKDLRLLWQWMIKMKNHGVSILQWLRVYKAAFLYVQTKPLTNNQFIVDHYAFFAICGNVLPTFKVLYSWSNKLPCDSLLNDRTFQLLCIKLFIKMLKYEIMVQTCQWNTFDFLLRWIISKYQIKYHLY